MLNQITSIFQKLMNLLKTARIKIAFAVKNTKAKDHRLF